MSEGALALDPVRIRELFDLTKTAHGAYVDDPYPSWHRLRESGPIHEGTAGRLIGFEGPETFFALPEPDRRHFTAFDFKSCDEIVRRPSVFKMSPPDPDEGMLGLISSSMLMMDGDRHRRYRSLVQPSFSPDRMPWWTEKWIQPTVDALIDGIESSGRADLNVDFCAAIPILTICGSFGVSVDDSLDIRAAVGAGMGGALTTFMKILQPIVEDRRREPRDDVISVLTQAELTQEGETHLLSDKDIMSFSFLLLTAGSGTTWKQMGITLHALLTHPHWLEAAYADPSLLGPIVEETARWQPTDPVFGRYVHEDTEVAGVALPRGSVVHVCYGSASRDPARWERPDEFDPSRELRANLSFGRGPHTCLGKNLARTEMIVAIRTLLERLPHLRPDPHEEPSSIVGLYERGPSTVPVVWG